MHEGGHFAAMAIEEVLRRTHFWEIDIDPIKTWELLPPVMTSKRQRSCGSERFCKARLSEQH
jgi:hypothetical protein